MVHWVSSFLKTQFLLCDRKLILFFSFKGSSKGDDGVYLYEPHSRPINCMSFDPNNCGKLYTASYDGTIRCCDVTSATFQEVILI